MRKRLAILLLFLTGIPLLANDHKPPPYGQSPLNPVPFNRFVDVFDDGYAIALSNVDYVAEKAELFFVVLCARDVLAHRHGNKQMCYVNLENFHLVDTQAAGEDESVSIPAERARIIGFPASRSHGAVLPLSPEQSLMFRLTFATDESINPLNWRMRLLTVESRPVYFALAEDE